jgi:hypothetical protein
MRAHVLAGLLVACGSGNHHLPHARFANAPPVTIVDDKRDVPVVPQKTRNMPNVDLWDASVQNPILRPLKLPPHRRALGVNSIDEVPDSAWFTNRITARPLSADEIRRGPVVDEGPERFKPWTVHSTKSGGASAGLIVTDARGVKFMLKFDMPDHPELESGAHIVVSRLLWASGYNVPEDQIVTFRTTDLVLAKDAKILLDSGRPLRTLTQIDLQRRLVTHVRRDGTIRVLASRWIEGDALGGFAREGTRPGDPNDRIPHELRRDLRGQRPILAWLDHVDLSRNNFLDVRVADPNDARRRYVEHFLIDFGRSLGVMAEVRNDLRHGWTYEFDWAEMFKQLFTLGLLPRPWGHLFAPPLPGVATTFVADTFEPAVWKPDITYTPFVVADRFDQLWGAKIVARFSPELIRAAVEAAQYSDPRAAEYMVTTLIARQRRILFDAYRRVNPLDGFAAVADWHDTLICFDDLAMRAGFVGEPTAYEIRRYDYAGKLLGPAMLVQSNGARTCTGKFVVGNGTPMMIEVTTRRSQFAGRTYVYVANDPQSHLPRVIGIWRI